MKHIPVSRLGFALSLVALLLVVSAALAANGYDLTWWTVDSGGGQSAGGAYTLNGSIGQPDVGTLTGGSYSLAGGFWGKGVVSLAFNYVYLPLVIK